MFIILRDLKGKIGIYNEDNAVKNTPSHLIRHHLKVASTSLHRDGVSHIKAGAWSNAHSESGIS